MGASPLRGVEVTRILQAWSNGDASALEQLTPVVYDELHRVACRSLAREREGHVLQPSALVNEAFIRLIAGEPVEWTSRAHFFAISARLMRQILIDIARTEETRKRGHRTPHLNLSSIDAPRAPDMNFVGLLDVDVALDELARLDARQAQIVELRYFGGLEIPEVAVALNISERTVSREWRIARAWLFGRLLPPPAGPR